MDIIKTKIGDIEVLIQSCDEKLEATSDESSLDALSSISASCVPGKKPKGCLRKERIGTKVETAAYDAFENAKKIIFNIAETCVKEMEERINKPDEFTLDFTLSFSAKSENWILGFENNAVLKVGMKWKSGDCENNDKVV